MDNQEAPRKVPPEKNRGGQWIPFGDEQYRVPPLGFRSIVELQDDVKSLAGIAGRMPTQTEMQTIAGVVHAAMRRNYPSLTVDDVMDMIDIGNYRQLLDAVMNVSGFQRQPEGAPSSGEAPASTGTASTPS